MSIQDLGPASRETLVKLAIAGMKLREELEDFGIVRTSRKAIPADEWDEFVQWREETIAAYDAVKDS